MPEMVVHAFNPSTEEAEAMSTVCPSETKPSQNKPNGTKTKQNPPLTAKQTITNK